MAISTYAQLKTAVEVWRERVGESTITGNAADFIMLGEAQINSELLNLNIMKTNVPLTGTLDSREIDLPSDYVEPKWLRRSTGSAYCRINKRTSDSMEYLVASGTPTEWCINGDHIDLNRPCSSALAFLFRYRRKFALSATPPADTNWLLTNYPNVYLGAVLVWSGLLLKADDIATWATLYSDGIAKIKNLDAKADADVELQVDPALVRNNGGVGRFDYTGGTWWV